MVMRSPSGGHEAASVLQLYLLGCGEVEWLVVTGCDGARKQEGGGCVGGSRVLEETAVVGEGR